LEKKKGWIGAGDTGRKMGEKGRDRVTVGGGVR